MSILDISTSAKYVLIFLTFHEKKIEFPCFVSFPALSFREGEFVRRTKRSHSGVLKRGTSEMEKSCPKKQQSKISRLRFTPLEMTDTDILHILPSNFSLTYEHHS